MLTNDDLKRYSAIVEDGSGCIFQPMTTDYTYILTAKHLFCSEIENEQGQNIKTKKKGGENIRIVQMVYENSLWKEKIIPFEFQPDENYFEHDNADIAILKIPYQEGFNQITVQDSFERDRGFLLCGFPNSHRINKVGDKYWYSDVESFGASNSYSYQAKLVGNLQQHNIEGFSGCGIFKLNNEGISIIGIQSEMASRNYPNGGIGFVPIKYAKEIIDYPQNSGKLSKLFPNTLLNFSFLKDTAFLLDVNSSDFDDANSVRTTLLNQAQNIIASDITPFEIKELFNKRLLSKEKIITC